MHLHPKRLTVPILFAVAIAAGLAGCDRQNAQAAQASSVAAPATKAATQAAIAQRNAQAAAARIDAKPVALSAAAELGKKMFYDPTLSASGRMACMTCHDPAHAFAPGNDLVAQIGGPRMNLQGARAVPSLTYHEVTPAFFIGPDANDPSDDEGKIELTEQAQRQAVADSGRKVASQAKSTADAGQRVSEVVPQGGMDWDGRAKVISDQAAGPLFDPKEMANTSPQLLLEKLKKAPYAKDMQALFGPAVFSSANLALGEAYFALAQYQKEERAFHPYDSKYDYYLAGRVTLSDAEMRGKKLFDDAKKGNCASCHIDKPSADGHAPMFTDFQFEALGAPRNMKLKQNADAHFYDEGICGPMRKDMAKSTQYCGLFKTPSLRNVATRHVFFHNGTFTSLADVVRFYVERETHPENWYPRDAHGKVVKYDDLPAAHRANIDIVDAPFDRKAGETPALTSAEIDDIVAFMKTLTDGYRPADAKVAAGTPQ
ncbi:MAG: c-type cytochrome [Burkholderiales bacterium]|nr:c-type cytochrome [Burkholderiales bacterium]